MNGFFGFLAILGFGFLLGANPEKPPEHKIYEQVFVRDCNPFLQEEDVLKYGRLGYSVKASFTNPNGCHVIVMEIEKVD